MSSEKWLPRYEELDGLILSVFTDSSRSLQHELGVLLEDNRHRIVSFFRNEFHQPRKLTRADVAREENKPTDTYIEYVNVFGDILKVDGLYNLPAVASSSRSRLDKNPLEAGIYIYHADSQYLIACLLHLLVGSADARIPESTRKLFRHHLDEIIQQVPQGFLQLCLKYLSALHTRISAHKTSASAAVPASLPASLTADEYRALVSLHVSKLEQQSLDVANLIFHLSYYADLSESDLRTVVQTLKSYEDQPVYVLYLLSSILTLDNQRTVSSNTVFQLIDNAALFRSPELRSVLALKIGMQLSQHRAGNSSGGIDDTVRRYIDIAVSTPIFRYLVGVVENAKSVLEKESLSLFLQLIKATVDSFLKNMGRTISDLKNRNEDSPENSNFEYLLRLISTIHGQEPDFGVDYWRDSQLFNFVKWARGLRSTLLIQAYIDMVGSIACGPLSANFALTFLEEQGLWKLLFLSLNKHTAAFTNPTTKGKSMDPEEIETMLAFLRLLKNVVTHSPEARITLNEVQHYRAVTSLFGLLVCKISIELKAALFDTVAAFALPIEHASHTDITQQIWLYMEDAQVISTLPPTQSQSHPQPQIEGLLYDLEETETASQTYPETLAFIRLINNLLHPHKYALNAVTFNTLGAGHRVPGIRPYILYIINNVFLKLDTRPYANKPEKYTLYDACLTLFERSMVSFDFRKMIVDHELAIQSVPGTPEQIDPVADAFQTALTRHPGFEIYRRVLSPPGSEFNLKLFGILKANLETLNQTDPAGEVIRNCVLLAMRIVYRILQDQDAFISGAIRTLIELRSIASPKVILEPPTVVDLSQSLVQRSDVVVHLARLINVHESHEICLLSVHIINAISHTSVFSTIVGDGHVRINRLVKFLAGSEYFRQIIYGFVERLELEESEELESEANVPEANLTLKAPVRSGLVNDIRIAILDLFLSNVTTNVPPPTVAHLLLGYDVSRPFSQTKIVDPNSPNATISCLHVILSLLALDTPFKADRTEIDRRTLDLDQHARKAFSNNHPLLSEKCHELIYRLCANPQTSGPTTRYLRTRESFFCNQIKGIYLEIEAANRPGHDGDTAMNGNSAHSENMPVKLAQLHRRSWLMKSIALELHLTSIRQQKNYTQRVIDLLFKSQSPEDNRMDEGREQPLPVILELLNFLVIRFDNLEESPIFGENYFKPSLYHEFLVSNSRGCLVYDIRTIHEYLMHHRPGGNDILGMRQAAKSILAKLVERNAVRELFHASQECISAWAQIVNTTLTSSLECIDPETRHEILRDILRAILERVDATETETATAETMSGVVIHLVAKLRQNRYRTSGLGVSAPAQLQPSHTTTPFRLPESTHRAILDGIVRGITRPDSTMFMRGNYYGALLQYLEYAIMPEPRLLSIGSDVSLHSIENGGERIYEVICRDAVDGDAIWKTVAFSVLASLVNLRNKSSNNRGANRDLVGFLTRRSFLRSFVANLAKDDEVLQLLIRDGAEDRLDALYIYETKMTLLLRIAQTPEGAASLFDSGIMDTLIRLKFIDQRPEIDTTSLDLSTLFPAKVERYQMALTSALRLITTLVEQLSGRKSIVDKIEQFVLQHQNVINVIMRDRRSVVTVDSLRELDQITTILSFLSIRSRALESVLPGSGQHTFQTLMTDVFARYSLPHKWLTQLRATTDVEVFKQSERSSLSDTAILHHEAITVSQQICRNVLIYLQAITDPGDHQFRPFFSPSLAHDDGRYQNSDGHPPLSVLSSHLEYTFSQYRVAVKLHLDLQKKLLNPSQLEAGEVEKIILKSGALKEGLTKAQKEEICQLELQSVVKQARRKISSSILIIEHLLLLLWRHLKYFLSSPSKKPHELLRVSTAPDSRDTIRETMAQRSEAARTLVPLLKSLQELDLDDSLIKHASERAALSQSISRQIISLLQPQQ
ncbi:nucleoporin Nup186/Nup192/Nup205 [Polychytrium aggregatum]|uniref:nucleoporin Nup186/Nup192/Nup205 n=1 Tax=Polychytrium aggregatum TaxID=110093 RepID=UPI0022FE0172|nr:nucleoporin Nup186/Nup192/Nup205 [Polychytrium aggregatum]KAI9208816.1 nucleoporin Nup186/Nup192/Nup205 [Polychytrium aggregatum]